MCWAPHEFGLVLVCGSSDGAVSVLSYVDASNSWEAEKIPNAHTIGCNAVSWAPLASSGTVRDQIQLKTIWLDFWLDS